MARLIALLMAVLTAILGIWCFAVRAKRRQLPKHGTVQLPFGMAVTGMVGGAIMCILAICFSGDGILPVMLFSAFILLADSLMVGYLNCIITYDSQGFTARNFFGIQRSCRYAQVTGIREGRDCWVYFEGHRILVDAISEGGEDFRTTLRKQFVAYTGTLLPERKRRWDPMNGHVEYPWFYFILWLVLAVCCLGITGMAVYSLVAEQDPADLVSHRVTFTQYKLDSNGRELVLYAPGYEKPFRIAYYEDYDDGRITPEALCGTETYTVYTAGPDGRSIYRMVDSEGAELIGVERQREIYLDHQRLPIWFMIILSPLAAAFSVFGIVLTRNPDRYPNWVKRLYYKEGYLH